MSDEDTDIVRPVKVIALGDRDTTFLTHREIDAALELFPEDVDCHWVATDSSEARELDGVDGVWLLPGTPYKDDDAGYAAISYCLESHTPFLGTCGGFQYACVELARLRTGVAAVHGETDPDGSEVVIVPLACPLYDERRLVTPVPGTRLAAVCGNNVFEGYHCCGYGLAERFAGPLAAAGIVISAFGEDAGVEAIELPEHPFFMATAFQPQVGSGSSKRLHPLLSAFLAAATNAAGQRLAA